jgi:tetratricopeptide (TPR) repeat protein
MKDKKNALESLERCISINPKSAFFLGGASFLMGCLGEYEESMEYFKQSHALNPYYPWWFNLGPIFINFYNGNYNKALEFADHINIPGYSGTTFLKLQHWVNYYVRKMLETWYYNFKINLLVSCRCMLHS